MAYIIYLSQHEHGIIIIIIISGSVQKVKSPYSATYSRDE